MSQTDAEKWNSIYASGDHIQNNIAEILHEYWYLLPASGIALDMACGTGNNAIFLAKQGLDTHAWDISDQAISRLQTATRQYHLQIHSEIRHVVKYPPEEDSYDVILVCHFLDRELFPAIIEALRIEGLLFYQTFIQEKIDNSGPSNPEYLLAPNELLHLCKKLHILVYREEGKVGKTSHGFRNKVMLIGQRRN